MTCKVGNTVIASTVGSDAIASTDNYTGIVITVDDASIVSNSW